MSDQDPSIDFSMVIASAVHDMKNSLGMLLHSLDELRSDLPDDVARAPRFNTLQYEAERVHSDLVQLLGLYRVQQRTLSAHLDEHYLPDVLGEQMARHQPSLEGRGIRGEIECPPINAYFDLELIPGVLSNIINNAVRYTHSRIRISAREEDDFVVLAVEDDGDGYPARMLEAPDASDQGISFSTGSTNLGLYFASCVARLHKEGQRTGFIKLRNGGELGGGIFEIWLP
ncbi:sensor histidine kinase [Mangrovitalea sediminis]|uniref:sensor histidine kinase n=1 Tax=Mangrovitalea sediminis TaxID=1982043 RepID=UPI001D0D585D|nr:HAMP domain-containing sensor histidine kinase [Mangrovitalea sediminis]